MAAGPVIALAAAAAAAAAARRRRAAGCSLLGICNWMGQVGGASYVINRLLFQAISGRSGPGGSIEHMMKGCRLRAAHDF